MAIRKTSKSRKKTTKMTRLSGLSEAGWAQAKRIAQDEGIKIRDAVNRVKQHIRSTRPEKGY